MGDYYPPPPPPKKKMPAWAWIPAPCKSQAWRSMPAILVLRGGAVWIQGLLGQSF